MSSITENGHITYLYKLVDGTAETSNAAYIAKLLEIPQACLAQGAQVYWYSLSSLQVLKDSTKPLDLTGYTCNMWYYTLAVLGHTSNSHRLIPTSTGVEIEFLHWQRLVRLVYFEMFSLNHFRPAISTLLLMEPPWRNTLQEVMQWWLNSWRLTWIMLYKYANCCPRALTKADVQDSSK